LTHQADFANLLIDAGAEHFDALALTAALGDDARSALVSGAFYAWGNFHLGPAVHAELNAALIDHLARGWADAGSLPPPPLLQAPPLDAGVLRACRAGR
jgi:hypothetical protein